MIRQKLSYPPSCVRLGGFFLTIKKSVVFKIFSVFLKSFFYKKCPISRNPTMYAVCSL